jgi:hypothetical protein
LGISTPFTTFGRYLPSFNEDTISSLASVIVSAVA